MRVIAEVPHPHFRITIFYMNQKYILKIESGNFEQNYKISEFDYTIGSEKDIVKLVSPEFLAEVATIFNLMRTTVSKPLANF
jgi:hypothetical protein